MVSTTSFPYVDDLIFLNNRIVKMMMIIIHDLNQHALACVRACVCVSPHVKVRSSILNLIKSGMRPSIQELDTF